MVAWRGNLNAGQKWLTTFQLNNSQSNHMPQLSPTLPCLIVLGSRLNPEGLPGRIARMRVEHALQIWREGGASGYLILTGGCSREGLAVSEARAMADYALARAEEHGGPELRDRLSVCLLLEEASHTTWDSACHTLPLILDLNIDAVGLVSDALHLRRAHYLFRRHYRRHPIRLQPLPVPGVIRHYWHHRRYLWLTRMALRETGAWLKVLTRRTRRKKTR
jgi:uncharacterized SAM-binding protein YcdF (DUF218 family)